jgi:hypothetical protein
VKHLRTILLVVLILVLASLACSIGQRQAETQTEPAVEATQPPAAQATPLPTEAPGAPPASEATEAVTESAGGEGQEEAIDLTASISELEELNSYRAEFRFDWTGTREGQPVDGYMQMNSAFVREPPAQELHFEGKGFEAGLDQGLGKVSFIQVGDTAWFYESESDTWMQVPAGDMDFAEGLFFQPEDLLADFDVSKADRSPIPQEVNGVQAYKYTFDETDFDLNDLSQGEQVEQAEGEVYVAADGDYIVRLIIDADLRFAAAEEMFEEGNIKMTFDISDVNQPITIEPPAEAAAQTRGREDVPLLPDADVQLSTSELISYLTASSVEDAAAFYEAEMPENGWTADEGNMVLDESAVLNYNKDNETASIIVGTDENGTSVLISIGAE